MRLLSLYLPLPADDVSSDSSSIELLSPWNSRAKPSRTVRNLPSIFVVIMADFRNLGTIGVVSFMGKVDILELRLGGKIGRHEILGYLVVEPFLRIADMDT